MKKLESTKTDEQIRWMAKAGVRVFCLSLQQRLTLLADAL